MGGLPFAAQTAPDRRFFTKGVMHVDIRNEYPDFAMIEAQIRRARVERSLALSQALVNAGEAIGRGLRRAADALSRGLDAERDQRAIEADAFLKRSVPRY